MFNRNKWEIKIQDGKTAERLCRSLGVSPICARLLINRGYTDAETAKAFMDKSDVFLYDPYLLADMKKAVARIKSALENDEKITIYGDYDVDGVTSVSILYMYLRDHGAEVDYYIPTRESEGYGINISAFDSIRKDGTSLVITVDTGITAIKEIDYAKSIGLDVVISDHHQCRSELPKAEAVVNPRRPDCPYPFKELSGVGVVFKLLCALELDTVNGGTYNLYTVKDMCRRYIDLVTIGTVADVMPLVGENRIIVYMGLQMLTHTRQTGVKALFRAAGIELDGSKQITSSLIGYTIAPRINAAGRIGDAARAVQLFLASSPRQADVIAEELCTTNRERQTMENEIYGEAIEKIETERDLTKEHVIVLSSDTWHHGVIGIVASRLTERYNLPSILISFDGSDDNRNIGKGSARSVKGLNLVEALAACEDTLCKYGGHELAAGLTIERGKLEEFREKLDKYVGEHLENDSGAQTFGIETEIYPDDVSEETVKSISILEPFGAGNPIPLFIIRNTIITQLTQLSLGKHTKMLAERDGITLSVVCFGSNLIKEGFAVGDEVDVVCSMDINEFRGTRSVQLVARDIDYSEEYKEKLAAQQKECDELLSGKRIPFESELPTRADCAMIYTELRNSLSGEKGTVSIKKLISLPGSPEYIPAGIALTAFAQTGLISLEKISQFDYRASIEKPTGKTELFGAPVMTRKRGES